MQRGGIIASNANAPNEKRKKKEEKEKDYLASSMQQFLLI